MIFPWEGTYWYLQCMRRIKCHMTNVPFSSPFFVSQPKRNGESTQLVWKQIPFRLRDSPIMHSSVPDEFKPVIFAAGSGCEWVGCFSGLPDWMGGYTGLRMHPVYWKIDEHWTAETQKWSFVCESVIHLFQGPHKLSHPLKFSKKVYWSHVLHPATTSTFKTPKNAEKVKPTHHQESTHQGINISPKLRRHIWVDDFPNFPFGGICMDMWSCSRLGVYMLLLLLPIVSKLVPRHRWTTAISSSI